ncbi:MAG: hypothetical protein ACOCY8_07540 [Spirochaetota bacterium]
MRYQLLGKYFLDQTDDTVLWMRIFADERKLMVGKGVYRDDVLVLLFPSSVDTITDLAGVRSDLEIDTLPRWNKTKYLVHMGNASQGYPVQEAIDTADGRPLDQDELDDVVDRIQRVFT